MSSHYLILPRISSLVVQGFGVSAPTAKAQGLILSFSLFCIFFSSGQVLLSIFSWCSACTSVSEGVFVMYPWREMYSTSIYSSTILFCPIDVVNILGLKGGVHGTGRNEVQLSNLRAEIR